MARRQRTDDRGLRGRRTDGDRRAGSVSDDELLRDHKVVRRHCLASSLAKSSRCCRNVIAQASGTSLLHAGRLERHLRLRSLGGPERTAAQEPRPALEGARNRGADGGLGANLSENGKLSSSARKECESLAEGC